MIDNWPPSPEKLVLDSNYVHIWSIRLDPPIDKVSQLRNILSLDECSKADRFYFERDRNHFIVARAMLRKILARYLDVSPSEIIFNYQKYGKPELNESLLNLNPSKLHNLRFNLSHSGELAICGITLEREIGVDIEHLARIVKDFEQIAERFFSPREAAEFRLLPQVDKSLAFFRCWTRKEAYIKAIGQGLSFPLDKFDVTFTSNVARLLRVVDHPKEVARWTLKELTPAQDYIGAVMAEGSWELCCYKADV